LGGATGYVSDILGPATGIKLRERRQWLEWGTVSGVVAGAPFAAFDCRVSHRHLPTPCTDGQGGATRANVRVPPLTLTAVASLIFDGELF
jgi:hypothetical protein